MNNVNAAHAERRQDYPPRLAEEFIQVVAQSIPGLLPLKPEVSKALAPDAEYRLREVIQRAKLYMQHSKRNTLSVTDVAAASKAQDNQINISFGSRGKANQFEYAHTAGVPGLYAPRDSVLALDDVICETLPPEHPPPLISTQWIAINGQKVDETNEHPPNGARLSRNALQECDAFRHSIMYAISEAEDDEEQVEAALKSIAQAQSIQPMLHSFVNFIQRIVHEHARAAGRTQVLFNATRLIYALLIHAQYGVELHYDRLMPALLTCLVGRRLGTGDHWTLREHAAGVLREAFERNADPVPRVRTTKTLVAVLTDKQAPLESIFGCIHGLANLGKDVFKFQLLPHYRALLCGLERATRASQNLDEELRMLVEEKVRRICNAIQFAITLHDDVDARRNELIDVTI